MHITATQGKKPFYKILYIQVLFAIGLGVVLGHWWPAGRSEALKYLQSIAGVHATRGEVL